MSFAPCATRASDLDPYADTSVLASLVTNDSNSGRARTWLAARSERLTLSDWTLTEFTSALGAMVRAGRVLATESAGAERAVDDWIGPGGAAAVLSEDIRQARTLMKFTQLPLRAGDALHIAIALRFGLPLASFDLGMRRAAADLGLQVEDI